MLTSGLRKTLGVALMAVVGAAGATLGGCGESGEQSANTAASAGGVEDVVRTTFYPATYMTERIAGGLVPVENPASSADDPAFYQPDAETIATYQRAKVVVVNGADFEKWVASAPLPRSRVVDASSGFEDRFVQYEGLTHSHGEGGEHSHVGTDGHTWVDPLNAVEQATAIAGALSNAFPEHAGSFEANAEALIVDLRALHESLAQLAPALAERTLMANHGSYSYLAQRHGLTVNNLDLDPEAEDAGEIVEIVRAELAELGSPSNPLLLWEAEPRAEIVERLEADLGVPSVVVSPVESQPEGTDYLGAWEANLQRLRDALQ